MNRNLIGQILVSIGCFLIALILTVSFVRNHKEKEEIEKLTMLYAATNNIVIKETGFIPLNGKNVPYVVVEDKFTNRRMFCFTGSIAVLTQWWE